MQKNKNKNLLYCNMNDFPLSKKMIRNVFTVEFFAISLLFLGIGMQAIQWFSIEQANLASEGIVFLDNFILQTNMMISLFFILSAMFIAGAYYIYKNIESIID
ncbi:MAG: hypothetical protein KAS30_05635 [Candidatus Diapherotrites archaeon]|nr:hypothetical protein [Candidatus Diapherotrites archaeon]